MPNGKVGDHPYTDIVHHGLDTYSPQAAALVREIAVLADERTRQELADLLGSDFNANFNPDVPKLEKLLTEMRDRLKREARERGYEVE
jgi:hypothetical protein